MGTWLTIGFRALVFDLAIPVALILLALVIVVYPLMFLWDEISGWGRRHRRLRSRMVDERPPLPDPDFLRAVDADEADAPLWLGARSRLAEYIGLPPEAIHPGDPMSEIWWMRWGGPEYLDFHYGLEWKLGIKIPRGHLDSVWQEMMRGDQEFGAFAELTVRALRQIREKTEVPF